MRKPDPEIYALTLERLGDGLEPGDCVFVDDVDVNCETARSLGMHAVHYRTRDQAIAEIRARDVIETRPVALFEMRLPLDRGPVVSRRVLHLVTRSWLRSVPRLCSPFEPRSARPSRPLPATIPQSAENARQRLASSRFAILR